MSFNVLGLMKGCLCVIYQMPWSLWLIGLTDRTT